jgi:hypothetical protein
LPNGEDQRVQKVAIPKKFRLTVPGLSARIIEMNIKRATAERIVRKLVGVLLVCALRFWGWDARQNYIGKRIRDRPTEKSMLQFVQAPRKFRRIRCSVQDSSGGNPFESADNKDKSATKLRRKSRRVGSS